MSGGGPQNTDCFLEWVSRPVPARKRDGRPRNLLVCYEGDPACDVDGVADNQACTIELRMCINNHDPRLPACVPSGVKSFEVKVPSLKSRDPADLVNRETLETHGGAGGLSLDVHRGKAALYAGTINAMPDRCVGPMAIQVPLRRSRSGKLSAGRRALRVKVTDSLGRADNNVLAIQCRPSTCGDGVIQSDREDCDQGAGNRVAGDGCDAACRVEPGWQCSGKPSVCSRSFPAGAFPDF